MILAASSCIVFEFWLRVFLPHCKTRLISGSEFIANATFSFLTLTTSEMLGSKGDLMRASSLYWKLESLHSGRLLRTTYCLLFCLSPSESYSPSEEGKKGVGAGGGGTKTGNSPVCVQQ